jgi:hypothetical protein
VLIRSRLLARLLLACLLLLGGVTLASLAGCTPAPLADKPCDCATGFTCCASTMRCVATGERCPCSAVTLNSPLITTGGTPLPSDLAPDAAAPAQLVFDAPAGQWVSYTFAGMGEPLPKATVTPDGDGFQIVATFADATASPNSYEGFGLNFRNTTCVDGSLYTGLQFDFEGDLGGRVLIVGATSSDSVTVTDDIARGACVGSRSSCYGPSVSVPRIDVTPVQVPFTQLTGGMPNDTLDTKKIVNVQWQLGAAMNPRATFTIRNVTFY